MGKIKTKVLGIKRLGWKRVAKNVCRFGWHLSDAEEETITETETEYEGTITDDKIYIKPHTKTTTKTTVWLTFWRDSREFSNLAAIFPIEFIYNIIFLARRIVGFALPLYLGFCIICTAFGFGSDIEPLLSAGGFILAGWLALVALENIFAIIAKLILKRK